MAHNLSDEECENDVGESDASDVLESMPAYSRSRDLKLQKVQAGMTRGLLPLVDLANKLKMAIAQHFNNRRLHERLESHKGG
jgi:hypothetical protein